MATYEVGFGLGAFQDTTNYTAELAGFGAVTQTSATQAFAFYYPTSTIQAGGWNPSTGGDIWAVLDEPTTPNSSDYASSAINPSGGDANSLILGFNIATPANNDTYVWKYQIWGTGNVKITVQVVEGVSNTVRVSWVHDPAPSTPTTYTRTLSPAEIASIADPTAQRLRIIAG